jgi:hypothetical protein
MVKKYRFSSREPRIENRRRRLLMMIRISSQP